MPKANKRKDAVDEVRRHGWLRDHHYELDHGPERRMPDGGSQMPVTNASPVSVTINVNLGDILDKITKGMQPKEALEEAIKLLDEKRQQLNEHEDG